MKIRWSISLRTVLIAWTAVIVTAGASLLIQRSMIRNQGLELERNAMRNLVLSAENTRTSISALNESRAFDRKTLLAEFRSASDYRATNLYATIPVVAAWKSIQSVADKEGYVFRTPSLNPRNPKNTPAPDEEKILADLARTGAAEYFATNAEKNEMIYARPIRLSQDCMSCHGVPSAANKDGKDVAGFRMEGWRSGEMHGVFLLRTSMARIDKQVHAGVTGAALWLCPAAILLGVGSFLAMRPVGRSLASAVQALEGISQGDLSKEIQGATSDDEVGDMTTAMSRMSVELRRMVQGIAASVGVLNTTSAELAADSVNVSNGSAEVAGKAQSLAVSAEEMSTGINCVAAAMEQASTNLKCVSASAGEMTSTIDEIARNSEKARTITDSATRQAKAVTEQMSQLGQAAHEIGKVTETISEISAQTNLLALNATIEAARAGAAGKGFSVVANEIKVLAQQAAVATEDIKARVSSVQSFAGAGVGAIEQIAGVINEVTEIVTTIAAAIEEQATVTRTISRNIEEAAIGVQDVNRQVAQSSIVTQGIAADVGEVDHAAGLMAQGGLHVKSSAARLSEIAGSLQETVGALRI